MISLAECAIRSHQSKTKRFMSVPCALVARFTDSGHKANHHDLGTFFLSFFFFPQHFLTSHCCLSINKNLVMPIHLPHSPTSWLVPSFSLERGCACSIALCLPQEPALLEEAVGETITAHNFRADRTCLACWRAPGVDFEVSGVPEDHPTEGPPSHSKPNTLEWVSKTLHGTLGLHRTQFDNHRYRHC